MMAARPDVDVRSAALAAYAAGLAVLPPLEDGTKAPDCRSVGGRWKQLQSRMPTPADLDGWYGPRCGLGIVCGAISGGRAACSLVALDFDDPTIYGRFAAAATEAGLGEVLRRAAAGYLESSPSGGQHILVRVVGSWECAKLARRPDAAAENGRKTLVEVKGEGGYLITAPSCGRVHPSERPYVTLSGSFAAIAELAPDEWESLCDVARSLDEMPRPEAAPRGKDRPGDAFRGAVTIESLLEGDGWVRVRSSGERVYWRRPGKDRGLSAATYPGGLLWVFSSSTDLPIDRTLDAFSYVAYRDHGGDFAAAARALAAKGYGAKEKARARPGSEANGHAPHGAEVIGAVPFLVKLSTVTPKLVEWLVPDRVPLGKLTVIAGDPGLGKSFITLDMIATLTSGGCWPGSGGECIESGGAILLSAEDDLDDTIRPRLDAMGADCERVYAFNTLKQPDGTFTPVRLTTDLPQLEAAFGLVPDVKLVVVDPVTAFLGRVDDHKNAELRGLLGPLAILAGKYRVAVVLVTHLNKSNGGKALYRFTGSLAYIAAARAGWLVVKDKDDPRRRLMLSAKNNLAADPAGLAYRIREGRVEWEAEPVAMTADEALRAEAEPREDRYVPDRDKAAAWLADHLADGPMPSQEAVSAGNAALGLKYGLKWWRDSILKARLGGKPIKDGYQGAWVWTVEDILSKESKESKEDKESKNPECGDAEIL